MTSPRKKEAASVRLFLQCKGCFRYCLFLPLAVVGLSVLQSSFFFYSNYYVVDDLRLSGSASASSSSNNGLPPLSLQEERPQIVWLASYPNSGTSYTMTLVQRASNRSVATNYGVEVTDSDAVSVPVHAQHPEGPFWEGLYETKKQGNIRPLPDDYVLTKTHCGGRCVNCPATDYVVNMTTFLAACERTTARVQAGEKRVEQRMDARRVAKLVHLIRNPFHNAVARFHLERRHLVRKKPEAADILTNEATGFMAWCRAMDSTYAYAEEEVFDDNMLRLLRRVPCHGEFYKHANWHNLVGESLPRLGTSNVPVLTLHYEDYATDLNSTATQLLEFLKLDQVDELRAFRELPTYDDHYSAADRAAAKDLVQAVASERTWKLLERYFV